MWGGGTVSDVCTTRVLCDTAVVAQPPALDYVRGRVPIYTITGAAKLLDVPASTFATWVNGYVRKPAGRKPVVGAGMVTRIGVPANGPSIPFVGLIEGMALAAFRRQHEIPFPRIRAVVTELEAKLGLEHALASRHLYILGPKLLYDYAHQAADPDLMDLVELDHGQAVFAPVVHDYLRRVTYDESGWAERLRVPIYRNAEVYADPRHGSGEPFFAPSGIPVLDVVGRYIGGDSIQLLSQDYDIPEEQIAEAVEIEQGRAA
jgi:uncharacterized protein (DUF433 family)